MGGINMKEVDKNIKAAFALFPSMTEAAGRISRISEMLRGSLPSVSGFEKSFERETKSRSASP